MKKKFLIAWLVLLCSTTLVLKAAVPTDSLRVSKSKKARFVFNLDARYTLLDNEPVRVSGLKSGVEWCNKYRTGVGFYFLSSPLVTRFPALSPDQPATETRLKFRYAAVYGEYVVLKNEKWEISLPMQAGYGKMFSEQHTTNGKLLNTETQPIWLVEPSVAGHYKIYNWVGIGAGVGYRQLLGQTNQEANHLNAPIYYIKAKLFLGDLYRLFRSKYEPVSPEN